MPRAAKKKVETKKETSPLAGLLSLAALGGMIKRVEREGSDLRITYKNNNVEVFSFAMPWQSTLVVMILKDMNTCVEQAKVTKVVKVLPEQRPE